MCWRQMIVGGTSRSCRGAIGSSRGSMTLGRQAVVREGQFGLGVRILHMAHPVGGRHKEHGAEITAKCCDIVATIDGTGR